MQAIILLIPGKRLMDKHKNIDTQIPDETVFKAYQIFPKNNPYLILGDNLNHIIGDMNLQILATSFDSNIATTLRLSLITAFQYNEILPDSHASDAVRRRIDWKYALFLPLTHPGISKQNLSQFRQKLISSSTALEEYSFFLSKMAEFEFFSPLTGQLPDAKTFLSIICQINRVFILRKAMKTALGLIVSLEPDWLVGQLSPHWFERYRSGYPEFNQPPNAINISSTGEKIGDDIYSLLVSVKQLNSLKINSSLEIKKLNYLFQQQFYFMDEIIYWRLPDCIYCICSDSLEKGG